MADDAVRNSGFLPGERRGSDEGSNDNCARPGIGFADRDALDQLHDVGRQPCRLRIDRNMGGGAELAMGRIGRPGGVIRVRVRNFHGHKDREHYTQHKRQQLAEFGSRRQK